ncbi:autophagy protein 5-like [Littorina saxatilis]|uniref:Autophagy protein 5 n=1 Tax=Littorina saxatilis TaxID=31220 RepID=A0AAN9BSF2_9CAEN
MADDREILREVWDGRIPVCFLMAHEEIETLEEPEPYFLLVPRQSYFPLVTDKAHRQFSKHLSPERQQSAEMWLEFDGEPLKWHYPVGVLFDLYGSARTLPWTLTVHYQNFPEDELLHCPCKEAVEAHFMATVKEADAMKHRGQIINGMQKKDHKQLWTGVQNDKFDQFWSVNRKLMESEGEDVFKHIPFRIHQPNTLPIQKLFKPTDDNGEPHTLEHLLTFAVPDLEWPDALKSKRVLVQGIEPSLSTPLLWMSEHLSYPDNFLHVCVVPKVENED